ncbi:glutamate receptor 1-like [Bradysia coprophila]|uniref:glutamate receptor 1-like n=1 Tax=Bradysia coprophila TaxID=38358 RepID=UPI00187D9539|nr:glutamate receptor 1-like [Bradysia coprophila]
MNVVVGAFIISVEVALPFLDSYSTVIYACLQRFSENHFVFVPTKDVDVNSNAMEILNHTSIFDVPNILIIMPNIDENSFDLITSQFVGRFNNTSPMLLDTFYGRNTTFKQNANLFPDKLSNLQQRVVRLALFNYKPYSVWEEVPSGLGNANAQNTNEEKTLLIDGTESILMLEFCTKHNCTLEISRDEAGEWGEIWDNRSGIGVLGAVSERRADVGISALYEWHHEYQFLDFTAPISRTGITCIVPRPKRLAGWLLPVWPFSWKLWVAVFLAFTVGIMSLLLARRLYITPKPSRKRAFQPKRDPAFNNVALIVGRMFLSQSVNIVVKRVPEMVILGCILLIGLMIGNTYSGGLAALMTVPQYEAPIDTPHQLAAKNLEWGATHDAWIFSILLATQPDIVKLLSLFKKSNFEKLRSRAKTGDFAFSIERLPYGSYAIGEYITEDNVEYLQLMPNDIYYEYALAMTTKTWALKPDLDTMILDIAQSGMQKYWENQVVMRYSDTKVQLVVSVSHTNLRAKPDPTSLSASQLVGVFIIWLIGIVISSFVFVWERLFTTRTTFKFL